MSRPTEEVKNHIVKCRIGDRLYDRISGENISEVMRNALESYVTHNNSVTHKSQDNSVKDHADERIAKLEADIKAKQERIAELEFLNDADYVEQLKKRIEELQTEIAGMRFLTPEYRDEVENMAEMTCGVERFYKSILEKVEQSEMDFNENGFDLTDAEVVEALRNVEIREQLDDMRKGCDEKQVDRVKAMTRALKQGLIKVRGEIWGIKN